MRGMMMWRSNVFLSSIAAMCIWAGNAHAAVLETNEWNNLTQAGWTYTAGRPVIDASAALPSGGPGLKFIYAPGTYTKSTGGGRAEFNGLSGRDIYVGHWMKFSNGFAWNPVGTKIDYQWVALTQTAINSVGAFTIRTDTYGSRLAVDVTIQGNGQFVGIPHTVYGNRPNPFTPGQIYWLEYHVKLNDVTAPNATLSQVIPNGILEVWIDDVLWLSRNDLRWTDREGQTWKTLQHSAEWGGSGGIIPAEQYLWVDHTVISTTRIGRPGTTPLVDTTAPRSPTLNIAN